MACAACSAKRSASITQMVQEVGTILPYLEFAYCAWKDQFTSAFQKVGVYITNRDQLKTLAELSDSGDDVKGVVPDGKGGYIKFSVINTVNSIDRNQPKISESCSIS